MKSYQNVTNKGPTIVSYSYMIMIFVIELKLHIGKCSKVAFGFNFDFLQFALVKYFKIFTICKF